MRQFTEVAQYGWRRPDGEFTMVRVGPVDGRLKRWLCAAFHDCVECGEVIDFGLFWSKRGALRWGDRWIRSFDVCRDPEWLG